MRSFGNLKISSASEPRERQRPSRHARCAPKRVMIDKEKHTTPKRIGVTGERTEAPARSPTSLSPARFQQIKRRRSEETTLRDSTPVRSCHEPSWAKPRRRRPGGCIRCRRRDRKFRKSRAQAPPASMTRNACYPWLRELRRQSVTGRGRTVRLLSCARLRASSSSIKTGNPTTRRTGVEIVRKAPGIVPAPAPPRSAITPTPVRTVFRHPSVKDPREGAVFDGFRLRSETGTNTSPESSKRHPISDSRPRVVRARCQNAASFLPARC